MKSNIIDKRIEIGRFSNFQFPNENRPNNSLCIESNTKQYFADACKMFVLYKLDSHLELLSNFSFGCSESLGIYSKFDNKIQPAWNWKTCDLDD